MRVLFTACPMFGHVNTLLPVALAARRAGHDVVFATGADLVAHVEARGLRAWPVGRTQAAAGGAPRAVADFATPAGWRVCDLLARVAEWRPALIVHDETELAALIAADRLGADRIVHGLGIGAAGSWSAFAPLLDEFGRTWRTPQAAARYLDAPYVAICPPSLQPPTEPPRRARHLLRPQPGAPTPAERLPAALATLPHRRTVHLTFGTVRAPHPSVFATVISGLRALDVNVVVTVGRDVDVASLGERPADVFVTGYLPHALLLPRCDVVVSHGGAGILLGSLAHGLPQLVLPQAYDQPANALAVERAGAGIALDPDLVTADRVTAAVRALLDNPAYRRTAAAVRAEIAAMPDADQTFAGLLRATSRMPAT